MSILSIRKAIGGDITSSSSGSSSMYENFNQPNDAMKLAVRKFVYSSYRIFKKLVEEARSADDIFMASQQLRDKLVLLSVDLENMFFQLTDNASSSSLSVSQRQEEIDEIEKAYHMISDMEKSWHICEIFHLNPTKVLSLELCTWLDQCGENLNYDENLFILKSMKPKPEGNDRYWPLLCQLCMRGHLDEAVSLLQIHSTLSSISNSKKKDSNDEKLLINTFFEILRSYPRFNNDQPLLDLRKMSTDFQQWYERVRKFQQISAKLISHIPELSTIIKILLGDVETLKRNCNGKWTNLTLALLLYVYPPPLTKIDLSKIVGEAMNEIDNHDETERRHRATMKDIMVGNLGVALKELYEMKSSCTGSSTYLSIVCLLNTAHLTFILAHGAHMIDFIDGQVDSSTDSPFCEELFLELGESLNFLEYPIDVMVFYFLNCKSKGKEYLRHLLPKRQITSDEDALAISSTLRSLQFLEDARVVEISRGTWWLQFNSDFGSNGAIKALYFYQLANDSTRSQAILDRAMWGCIIAVCASVNYFNDLLFTPTKPTEGSFQYTSYDDKIYFQGDDVAKENRLFTSLAKADELIGTIIEDGEVAILAQNLGAYVQAIRLRLLILVPQDDVLSKLKKGGAIIFNLLETSYSGGHGASIRYWLHLIDLCAWFDEEYRKQCQGVSNSNDNFECTIFTKRDVLLMLQAIEMVLQAPSYGEDLVQLEAAKTDELRKKILGIFTASIVQHNTVKNDEKKSFITSRPQFGSNYDILTANSFNRYF